MRRNVALLAECEDTTTSDAEAAREKHQEKLIKVEDALIKVLPRSDATTTPFTGRWANSERDDREREKGQMDDGEGMISM